MNKKIIHPATFFFLLTLVVAFLSWIGTIYGWTGVKNLLNTEGLRWMLRNVVPGFLSAPLLGELMIAAFGVGLCLHSGWWRSCRLMMLCGRKLSKKEKRAWTLSVFIGILWLTACVLATFGPWNVVRSVTGGMENSPVARGFAFLLSAGLGMMAAVYGYAVDLYRSDRDVVNGMACCFRQLAGGFVTLFFVVQFFTSLHYTGFDGFFGLSPDAFDVIYSIFAILSWFCGFV